MRYSPDCGLLCLVPRCGACADTIFRHEKVVALFGDETSTSYRGRTRPFRFPQLGYPCTKIDGYLPCRHPTCSTCALSPECVPIHHDCLAIFTRECPLAEPEALARLWTIGCYRNPWPRTPLLHLAPRGQFVEQKVFLKIAHICGIPRLHFLPPELVELIQQLAPHALFWRALSTISLANRVTTPPQPLLVIPLRDIKTWERGKPVVRVSELRRPMIRLTIDADGIRKIDRLPASPKYRRDGTANSRAYIVETEESLASVQVHLKDDLLRLALPSTLQALRVWDTPAPPNLSSCFFFHLLSKTSWQRFRTVDLATIRGITFFYSVGRLIDVHIHDSPESCALCTYSRLSNRCQKGAVWIYLPIAEHDTVVAVGVRGLFDIHIRTRLAGDIIVGSQLRCTEGDRLLGGSGEQVTLIYGETRDGESVPLIGGHCPTWSPLPRHLTDLQPRPESDNSCDMHFSSAPLGMVSSASVLYDEENGLCRGILFEYENGGLRAVGQCRLHVDPSKKYMRPSRICYRTTTCSAQDGRREVRGIYVEFRSGHSHHNHPPDDGWQCRALGGTMVFWFSNRHSLISVEEI